MGGTTKTFPSRRRRPMRNKLVDDGIVATVADMVYGAPTSVFLRSMRSPERWARLAEEADRFYESRDEGGARRWKGMKAVYPPWAPVFPRFGNIEDLRDPSCELFDRMFTVNFPPYCVITKLLYPEQMAALESGADAEAFYEITMDVLRAIKAVGPAAAVPASLGIGGILTELSLQTWRSTFWFMTGLSALCCMGGYISIDKDVPYALPDKRIDWLGVLFVTAGVTFIIFILSDGSVASDRWKTGCASTSSFAPSSEMVTNGVTARGACIDIIALLILGVLSSSSSSSGSATLSNPGPRRRAQPEIVDPAPAHLATMPIIAFVEGCSFQISGFWVQLYYPDYVGLNAILTIVQLLPIPRSRPGPPCLPRRSPLRPDRPRPRRTGRGFPTTILTVFGADFVFATGTLFVARVCRPHEQSVGGALFQTLTELGTAFGLAISTIVFNAARGAQGAEASRATQLAAYKTVMWSRFAFGMFGVLLAVLSLRSVGVVGHQKGDVDAESEKTATDDVEAVIAGSS
ncbi:hypothetical protein LXA43DRAFT_1069608 [Ganoderma leucocontextum]|nr:hypothetical protein LXA43DRAFT_1069608 [Ganoderma leucocontextum]